jgi:hypothetical protein
MPKLMPKKAGEIRDSIRKWRDAWKYNDTQYHDEMMFVLGEQWNEEEAKVFEDYKKIPLTFNKLATYANHLLGEQRQNTPNLKVEPDESTPADVAEIREAINKDIMFNSNASMVFQTAFEQAIIGGYGAWWLDTEYDSDDSFTQHIVINKAQDPTQFFWDLSAESPCKTDGMYAGFVTPMSRKKFAKLYGKELESKIGATSFDMAQSETDSLTLTFTNETDIWIVNWNERIYSTETIYQLSNGESASDDELDSLESIEIEDKEYYLYKGEPVTIINKRKAPRYKIKRSKWAGDYRLDITDFPSKQLPIVFNDQHSYRDKTGKQICRTFFRDAKDAQRYLNYLKTQAAYMLKISRYDQFMGSAMNVRSARTQTIWKNPNEEQGMLIYDESPNGNKPERLSPPELSISLGQQAEACMMDIQTSCGMFTTMMGDQGDVVSGVASDAQTKRSNYTTYYPFDSLNRSIACTGEIIDEMIPTVYDTERKMRLNLPDKGMTNVTINQKADNYGTSIKNDVTKGNYKVRLLPGSSFEGQKSENLKSLELLLQNSQEVFPLIADLVAKNLPMSDNIDLVNRLKTIVPPDIMQAGKTGQPLPPKPPQQDPMVALKQQELQIKIQGLEQKNKADQMAMAHKMYQLQLEAIESHRDASVEMERLQAEKAEAAAKYAEQKQRYEAELMHIRSVENIAHANNFVKLMTHEPKERTAESRTQT